LFGTTPLKAQNDKNARNLPRMPPWLRLCPQPTYLALKGDLALAGTTLVTPVVNVYVS